MRAYFVGLFPCKLRQYSSFQGYVTKERSTARKPAAEQERIYPGPCHNKGEQDVYKHIMVPVDLAHAGQLDKALTCAADLAKLYGAKVTYVAVAAATPGAVAHNPKEFAEKLSAFADAEADKHGISTSAHAVTSHDPTIDLDPTLLKSVTEIGADLVVMASHVPNITDYIWPSNGGTIAGHAKVTVMVVR